VLALLVVEALILRGTVLLISLLIPLWISAPVSEARAVEAASSNASSNASSMAKRLDRLIARKPLAKGSVGMLVVRASDGATVYSRGADRPLIPASNQKILTAVASLSRFGPSHRFATRIWSNAAPDTNGLVDQLLVEGGGDPAMNSEDWWRLAADLRREGLRGVRGNLWVDDSRFEAPGWHPSWGRISARAYHAPVGALTANYGTFFVSIWPGTTEGASVLVDIDPPVDYLRVQSHARTASRKARRRLSVDRAKSSGPDALSEEVVRVDGIARVGDGVDRFPRSVLDPGLYAGSLLAHQLGANDVIVTGSVVRGTRADTNGGSWVSIMDRPGRAVSEVVALCMKYSNNSIAESLVKNLGAWEGADLDGDPARQGNWTSGIKAMRAQLGAIGVNLGDANLVDGSGLSVQNRITPRAFVNALTVARESFEFGPEFVAAMPIAEVDGTLEKRMRGSKGRVRAKTGLLSDAKVTALSGYAERADGEVLIFSILVNGHSGGSAGAMDAVDELAATLLNTSLGASAN
jgi:D-alanyl-D-alanine carboxypeptidase/D-alanyl-D-alanine-endopeptidase (penicillin-binding protein 4)